jgi:hypothetical protein
MTHTPVHANLAAKVAVRSVFPEPVPPAMPIRSGLAVSVTPDPVNTHDNLLILIRVSIGEADYVREFRVGQVV